MLKLMSKNMRTIAKDVQGAAAFLTVIVLAILLTVIVTGLLRLSIVDSRDAIDDDLTNRAFFAAESGINQVAQELVTRTSFTNADNCTSDVTVGFIGPDTDDTEITCELIDLTPGEIEAELTENESFTAPLRFAGNRPQNVTVRWHQIGDVNAGGNGDMIELRNATTFLPQNDWVNGRFPAVLRITIIDSPGDGLIDLNAIGSRTVFAIPSENGIGDDVERTGSRLISNDGAVVGANCRRSGINEGFACEIDIPVPVGGGTPSIKVQPIYGATSIQVDSGDTADFREVQATVDITARAGDVFRRIRANVDLTGGSAVSDDVDPIPDAALVSGEGICKQITIGATVQDDCPNP